MSAPESYAPVAIDPKFSSPSVIPLERTYAPTAPRYNWLSFSKTGLSKYMTNAKNPSKNATKKGGRGRRRHTRRARRT
jgi:hypothetical protein